MEKTIKEKKILDFIKEQKFMLTESYSESPKEILKFMKLKKFSREHIKRINKSYKDFCIGGLAVLKMLEDELKN